MEQLNQDNIFEDWACRMESIADEHSGRIVWYLLEYGTSNMTKISTTKNLPAVIWKQ